MPLSSCYLAQPAACSWGGWATALLPRGPVTFPLKLILVVLVKEMFHQPQDIGVHLVSRTISHQSATSNPSVPETWSFTFLTKSEACNVLPSTEWVCWFLWSYHASREKVWVRDRFQGEWSALERLSSFPSGENSEGVFQLSLNI